jgi:plasmid stabilization system protein ParE
LAIPARHLLYGKRNGVYRIIFHIREEERHVRVLRVWHASRDTITAADVEE